MTLAELADQSGVPARTIRFYIARGLLDGPVKAGRAAEYSEQHLSRLDRIKALQAEGRTLTSVARALDGEAEPHAAPATPWWQYAIAEDVVVFVNAGASPWRMKQLQEAIDEFARRARKEKGKK